MKKTKIICSIGPNSNDVEVMEQLALNGMNVARLNFSHATKEEREKFLNSVRTVRKTVNKNIAILWDTKGPEFRCGMMENDKIFLEEGKTIRVVKEKILGTSEAFSVNHPNALDSIRVGSDFLLENAKMKLKVIAKDNEGLTCEIVNGGWLGNKKSLSVPKIKLDIPYISEEDAKDIEYACQNGGEFLAISFVSCVEDVLSVKELLKKYHREDLQIICKIESQLGIDNLESILKECAGIMVARGDLGSEVPSEMLPILQKKMIKACRKAGKICIVATEMLETMMENMRPKRAETSDIANAVLDGTDAVMLSGETTVGKHPVETVKAMAKICETIEPYAEFDYIHKVSVSSINDAIATSVVESCAQLNAKIICAPTVSGFTARSISNLKPTAPILAPCINEKEERKLALNYGVYTVTVGKLSTTDEVLSESVNQAKKFMPLEKGDKIIITGGFPTGHRTNLMKIEEI